MLWKVTEGESKKLWKVTEGESKNVLLVARGTPNDALEAYAAQGGYYNYEEMRAAGWGEHVRISAVSDKEAAELEATR